MACEPLPIGLALLPLLLCCTAAPQPVHQAPPVPQPEQEVPPTTTDTWEPWEPRDTDEPTDTGPAPYVPGVFLREDAYASFLDGLSNGASLEGIGQSATLIDLDLDGDYELATNSKDHTFLWDVPSDGGAHTLSDLRQTLFGLGSNGTYAHDMNGDTHPDLVTFNKSVIIEDYVTIFFSPFDMSSYAQLYSQHHGGGRPCFGDVNGDSFTDVVMYGSDLKMFFGPFAAGETRLQEDVYVEFTGPNAQGVFGAWCDVDLTDDGVDDLVIFDLDPHRLSIVPGPFTSDGPFNTDHGWKLPQMWVQTPERPITDLDGQGTSGLIIRYGDDDGHSFVDILAAPITPTSSSVPVVHFERNVDFSEYHDAFAFPGDVTGDGFPDILRTAWSDTDGYWAEAQLISGPILDWTSLEHDAAFPVTGGTVFFGEGAKTDLDGDGILDFTFGQLDFSGAVFVYRGMDYRAISEASQ